MNCKICNSHLDEGSLICPVCNFDNEKEIDNGQEKIPSAQLIKTESEQQTEMTAQIEDTNAAVIELPKKRFPTAAIIIAALIIFAFGCFFLWRSTLNSPQVRMGLEISEFLSGFFDIKGEKVFSSFADSDYYLTSNINLGSEFPLLGKSGITVVSEKTQNFAGTQVGLTGGQVNLMDVFLMSGKDNTVLSSKLGTKYSSGSYPLQGEPSDPILSRILGISNITKSQQNELLIKTSMILFGCLQDKWFFEESDLKYVILGNSDISQLAGDFKKGAEADKEYIKLLDDCIGEKNRIKFLDYLASVPVLMKKVPMGEFRIESRTKAGTPISLALKAKIPGFVNLTFLMQKIVYSQNNEYYTEYEISLDGEIANMATGQAELRAQIICEDLSFRLNSEFNNNTNGQNDKWDITGNIDWQQNSKDYFGTGKIQLYRNDKEYLPIDFDISLSSEQSYSLLPVYEQCLLDSQSCSSIADLIAKFFEGMRIDEIISAFAALN